MSAALRVLLAAGLALGCGPPPGVVRSDVQAYLARTQTWAPVEAETARTLERILRTEFVDEAEVERQIADSRPRILAHLGRVRDYAPRSEPVRKIHTRYQAAWHELLAGYDAIEDGFRSGDHTKLARGREAMAAWRAGILRVARDVRDLMQRFDVQAGGATES